MLESGLSGSVRGVPSNGHPYRDPRPKADMGSGPLKSASDAWLIRDSDTFRARS